MIGNKICLNIFYLSGIVLLISSCKTTKNTAMHRGWHNMNARYNGYYNARENLKESVKKVETANKDDLKNFATKDDLKREIRSVIDYMDGFFVQGKKLDRVEKTMANHEVRLLVLEQK